MSLWNQQIGQWNIKICQFCLVSKKYLFLHHPVYIRYKIFSCFSSDRISCLSTNHNRSTFFPPMSASKSDVISAHSQTKWLSFVLHTFASIRLTNAIRKMRMPLKMVSCYTLLQVFAKSLAIRKMRTVLQMVFMLRGPGDRSEATEVKKRTKYSA